MKNLAFMRIAILAVFFALPWADAAGQVASDVPGTGSIGESGSRSGTSGAAHLLVPLTARYASLGASTTGGLPGMSGLEALHALQVLRRRRERQ